MLTKYRIALLGALALLMPALIAAPAEATTIYPNGRICANAKSPESYAFSVLMDSGRGLLQWVSPKNGYCTDYYKPGWWIDTLSIDPHRICYSQWGGKYSGGDNGKNYTWTGGSGTTLTLSCVKDTSGSW